MKVELQEFILNYAYQDPRIQKYRHAHQSDFIRLEKLLAHGGVYADIDTIFVHRIPEELFSKPFVLGREDDIICQKTNVAKPSLCNAFIMSEQGAPFGRLWLEEMEKVFDGS